MGPTGEREAGFSIDEIGTIGGEMIGQQSRKE
jgi:hypothetical protein